MIVDESDTIEILGRMCDVNFRIADESEHDGEYQVCISYSDLDRQRVCVYEDDIEVAIKRAIVKARKELDKIKTEKRKRIEKQNEFYSVMEDLKS